VEFDAAITRVEPAAFTKVSPLGVEEQRVNVLAKPASPPVGLGDGFRVVASIIVWSAESVLTVPSTSLVPAEETWGVYVVEEGRARFRAITLGEQGRALSKYTASLGIVIEHPNDASAMGAYHGTMIAAGSIDRSHSAMRR
jgi:HlyD family secretion protein